MSHNTLEIKDVKNSKTDKSKNSKNLINWIWIKVWLIVTTLFGLVIIIDFEFLTQWKSVEILEINDGWVAGNKNYRGDYVSKVDLGFKTILLGTVYGRMLSEMDSVEVNSTAIFRQITEVKILEGNQYTYIQMEYGLQNGYYIFPLILIITSVLGHLSKSNEVRGYSFLISTILVLFILYVLFLN